MKNDDNRKYSELEISQILKETLGKTFGEINQYEIETFNKGTFGHIYETDVYGYNMNSYSEPDFIDAGIELKVTPYKKNNDNTLSAKERLVFNIINYDDEIKNPFRKSHFWYKNNKVQIIWYLWEPNKKKSDFRITHEKLLNLALSEDLKQIEEDWNTIINKIKAGKAHEISEADTMYLGACTKGANANSLRSQPFSNIKAKQRAFCFKVSYMTQLVRKYIGRYEDVERFLNNKNISITEFIDDIVNKYKGKTQTELMNIFNIDTKAKNIRDMIIRRMFNVKGELDKTEEFMKANIIPRTLRVEENGRIIESLSFPAFKYKDIINEEWENSLLKNTFEETKYIFFIFKNNGKDYVFKGIKLWNMPEMIIEGDLKNVWQKTIDVIKSGNIVKEIDENGRRITNFPGMSENRVCHVRPHGRDSKDTFDLPVPDKLTGATKYTKYAFWLNNSYLKEVISDCLE